MKMYTFTGDLRLLCGTLLLIFTFCIYNVITQDDRNYICKYICNFPLIFLFEKYFYLQKFNQLK